MIKDSLLIYAIILEILIFYGGCQQKHIINMIVIY